MPKSRTNGLKKIKRNPYWRKGGVELHYGFLALVILFGFLFPPLAVGMRFGIGKDFFINLLLTIMGFIPGQIHNFFLQSVRNNRGRGRTPKWAVKSGMVRIDNEKSLRKKEWAHRYAERTGANTYDDEGYEDEHGNHVVRRATGAEVLERRRGSKQQDQHTDGVEHDLYGPAQTQANTSDRYDAVDSLPGAGERGKRKTGGKLAGLRRPSAFSSRRGSAATSQGLVEERTNSYYDRDAPAVSTVDNVLDHDLHATSPRLGGGFKRPSYTSVPRENAGDPLGVSNSADFLSHDLQRSSLAARDQGDTLERRRAAIKAEREPWAAQDERSRLVDASGDLDHRF